MVCSFVRIAAGTVAIASIVACSGEKQTAARPTVTTTSVASAPQDRERSEAAIAAGVRRKLEGVQERCGAIPREIDRYEATLRLEIADSGRVEIADARGNHPIIDACVSDLARSWTFEPASARTRTDVSFTMSR